MSVLFIISLVIAVFTALNVISRRNPVHALLYMVVFFFSMAMIFFLIGAPFTGILEIIIYGGAIVTLFIFVVMMLNVGTIASSKEMIRKQFSSWWLPALLIIILQVEFIVSVLAPPVPVNELTYIGPADVGNVLITKYILAVELTGMLLMAGIIGAYHLGKQKKRIMHRYLEKLNES